MNDSTDLHQLFFSLEWEHPRHGMEVKQALIYSMVLDSNKLWHFTFSIFCCSISFSLKYEFFFLFSVFLRALLAYFFFTLLLSYISAVYSSLFQFTHRRHSLACKDYVSKNWFSQGWNLMAAWNTGSGLDWEHIKIAFASSFRCYCVPFFLRNYGTQIFWHIFLLFFVCLFLL